MRAVREETVNTQQQPSTSRGAIRGRRVQGPVVASCRSLVLRRPVADEGGPWHRARADARRMDAEEQRRLNRNNESREVGERTPGTSEARTPPDVNSVGARRAHASGRAALRPRVPPRGASSTGLSAEERMRFKAG